MAPIIFFFGKRDQGFATGVPDVAQDGVHHSAPLSTTALAGIIFAAVLGAVAVVWAIVWWCRLKRADKKVKKISATYVDKSQDSSTTSLVNDEKTLPQDFQALQGEMKTRGQLTASVIMPSKAVVKHDVSREEILQYHQSHGTVPRPFSPLSLAASAAHDRKRGSSPGSPSSVTAFLSSRRTSTPTPPVPVFALAQRRNVMQAYDPILPDELPARPRELLSILKTYDDGWCVVGRESRARPGEIELGVVPAWIFVRPVKGLGKPERPMRSFSLGVMVELDVGVDNQSHGQRIVWSNRSESTFGIAM